MTEVEYGQITYHKYKLGHKVNRQGIAYESDKDKVTGEIKGGSWYECSCGQKWF